MLLPGVVVVLACVSTSYCASISNETVDICSLDWISKVPELADLKGIRVPAGQEGLCRSFRVIYDTFGETNEQGISLIHQAAKKLFREDLQSLDKCSRGYGFPSEAVLHQALIDNDWDFAEFFLPFSGYWETILNPRTSENLKNYLRTRPEKFLEIFPKLVANKNVERFLLELGYNQQQLAVTFQGKEGQAVAVIKAICVQTAASYLLLPEIKEQVMHIYGLLSEENKLKVQLLMYYRELLSELDPSISLKPSKSDEYRALLLGRRTKTHLVHMEPSKLLDAVYYAAESDPSVLDWLIGLGNRFMVNPTYHLVPAGIYATCVPSVLSFKKVVAFAYTGNPDFLRFLQRESDILEQFPKALEVLASQGTVEETSTFLGRASEETISQFFEIFWDAHGVQAEFFECATLLIERVKRIGKTPKTISWDYTNAREMQLLKNPQLLAGLKSIGVKLQFKLHSLRDAVIDDQVFEGLLSVKEVFEGALERFNRMNLNVNGIALDRIMKLLNVSAHDLLKAAWQTELASLYQTRFKEIFLFLKKWKRDHPEEVAALVASDGHESVEDSRMVMDFDEESKELIRAHLLLGQSP